MVSIVCLQAHEAGLQDHRAEAQSTRHLGGRSNAVQLDRHRMVVDCHLPCLDGWAQILPLPVIAETAFTVPRRSAVEQMQRNQRGDHIDMLIIDIASC